MAAKEAEDTQEDQREQRKRLKTTDLINQKNHEWDQNQHLSEKDVRRLHSRKAESNRQGIF